MGRLEELKIRWEKERSSRAFLPLAEEYRRLGRLADAERICREGLLKHPTYHSARVLLGRTLLELDHLEEAAEEFKAVLEAEPQNLLAGRLLAGIHRNQGRWSDALETFRRLQTFYPDDADVRAQVYQLERGPEEENSRARSGAGPAASADHPLATNTLAEIFLGQGLVDRAVAVYENMLRADPDNQGVRRRIAEILSGEPAQSAPAPEPPAPEAPASVAPSTSFEIHPRRRVIEGLQEWLIAIQRG